MGYKVYKSRVIMAYVRYIQLMQLSLSFVRFLIRRVINHGTCYKLGFLSLVEITAFRLEIIFQPMRALEFITGHMVYNPAYN